MAEDGYEKVSSYRGIWPRAGRASHTGRSDLCEDWSATSEARGCDRSTESASCLGSGLLPVFRFAVCVDAGLLGDSAAAPDCVGTGLLESTARLVCLGKWVLAVGCDRPGGTGDKIAGGTGALTPVTFSCEGSRSAVRGAWSIRPSSRRINWRRNPGSGPRYRVRWPAGR